MSDNGDLEIGSEQHFYRIGQVCRLTDVKSFTLRYWESEFPILQPVKSSKGHRLYRREDVQTVLRIKRLLYDEGFTIAGARRYLRDATSAVPDERAAGELPQIGEEAAYHAAAAAAGAEALLRGSQAAERDAQPHPVPARAANDLEGGAQEAEELDSQYVGSSASGRRDVSPSRGGDAAAASRTDAANMLSRKLLLDLRDSLRAFLTLLENE